MRARFISAALTGALAAATLPLLVGVSPASAAGAPAASFTASPMSTWQTDGVAYKVVGGSTGASAGKVFIGGEFDHVRPAGTSVGDPSEVVAKNFVVLDAATGAPSTSLCTNTLGFDFPSNSQGAGIGVHSLALSPDGNTLYIGGYFTSVTSGGTPVLVNGSGYWQFIAAISLTGPSGTCTPIKWPVFPNGDVRAIYPTATSVFYGGSFGSVNTATRYGTAAASAVGQPNAGALLDWAPVVAPTTDSRFVTPVNIGIRVLSIVPTPSGDGLLLAGYLAGANSAISRSFVVVNSTVTGATAGKTNVHTFSGVIVANSVIKDVVSDGTNLYTASEGSGLGVFDGRMAFRWSDYSQLWIDKCLGATQAVAVYSGILYGASHGHDCSNNTAVVEWPDGIRHHLHAQPVSASTNPPAFVPWFPDTSDCHYVSNGSGGVMCEAQDGRAIEGIGPRDLAIATDGTRHWIFVVGEFTDVLNPTTGAYTAQQGVTRFGVPGEAGVVNAPPTTPAVSATSSQPGVVRVSWRPGVDRDTGPITYKVFRDGGATAIFTTTTTSWMWDRRQVTYVDGGLPTGTTHTYVVTATDGTTTRTSATASVPVEASTSPYAAAVLASSPTLYLRYDQNGDIFLPDEVDHGTGLGNNLTINNDYGTTGASFSATNAGAVWGSNKALVLAGNAGTTAYSEPRFDAPATYSIETWFKADSGATGKIVGFGNKQISMSDKFDRMIWLNGGAIYFGAGTSTELASGTGLDNGAWHHVVATQGSGGMTLYIDGAQVAHNSVTTAQSYIGYWHVGGDRLVSWANTPASCSAASATSYDCPFAGSIDETAVYPTALSATTVASHHALATQAGQTASTATPSVSLGTVPSTPVTGIVNIPFTATTSDNSDTPLTVDLYDATSSAPVATATCTNAPPATTCGTPTIAFDTSGYAGKVTLHAVVRTVFSKTAISGTKNIYVRSGTTVSLTVAAQVKSGTAATVSGKVTATASGQGVGGVQVVITGKPRYGSTTPVSATVTTSATGMFTTSFKVPNNATFTATVSTVATATQPVVWWTTSTTSAVQKVTAAMTCTRSATTVRSGRTVTISCKAAGLPTGTAFQVYRYQAGHWAFSGYSGTAVKGTVTSTVRLRGKGTTTILRFVVAANGTYETTWAPTLPVRIV